MRIVITTDFSLNAQKAIDYALWLFRGRATKFYILHAYQNIPSSPENKTTTYEKLKDLVKSLKEKSQNPQHSFKSVLISGSILYAISEAVKEKQADFVFIGTQGSSALKEIYMGSNAVNVIKNIDSCPVVAVPTTYEVNANSNEILFPNDLNHAFSPEELKPLINMVKLSDSTLAVVYFSVGKKFSVEDKLRNKELLGDHFKEIKSNFIYLNIEDSISSAIVKMEQENQKIQMVAMFPNPHGFLEKLMREPVIRNVVFKTEVPFLVLPKLK
ncbi:universal stress protein [uncultured Kriegella sp.]|uniref:universal stress protein n=1 Tax=uncultured Kriegella sp. TaxID=1798910 RepID=UPI0030D7B29E|tara:strand:- start:69637 stop:70449 length:813 start_codon:yes stop_codon:yes gene_type:complete